MCLSIPFKIKFKNFKEILEECFGLKREDINENNLREKIINSQPKKQDVVIEMGNLEEEKVDSDEELSKSYDII